MIGLHSVRLPWRFLKIYCLSCVCCLERDTQPASMVIYATRVINQRRKYKEELHWAVCCSKTRTKAVFLVRSCAKICIQIHAHTLLTLNNASTMCKYSRSNKNLYAERIEKKTAAPIRWNMHRQVLRFCDLALSRLHSTISLNRPAENVWYQRIVVADAAASLDSSQWRSDRPAISSAEELLLVTCRVPEWLLTGDEARRGGRRWLLPWFKGVRHADSDRWSTQVVRRRWMSLESGGTAGDDDALGLRCIPPVGWWPRLSSLLVVANK